MKISRNTILNYQRHSDYFNKKINTFNEKFNLNNFNIVNNLNNKSINKELSYFDINKLSNIESTNINNLESIQSIALLNSQSLNDIQSSLNTQSIDINNSSLNDLIELYENYTNTVDRNNNANSNTTTWDLSPSKVSYSGSKGDIVDKTKAKPSMSEIESWVNEACKKYNIDPSLIMGMIKAESSFNNQVISKSGAVGLMQLMPETAKEMGLQVNSKIDERWDPKKNIEAGIAYISKYHKIISDKLNKEDWNLTIAGYNCGPNRVIKNGSIPNIKETQNYVSKVNKYWKEFEN